VSRGRIKQSGRAIEIIHLAIDLVLSQVFPRFEKLPAAFAFKRQCGWFRGVREFFVHRRSPRTIFFAE
jgi:hypothetical protein